LGTQGWRRFAEQDPVKFREKAVGDQRHLVEADRLLKLNGAVSEPVDVAREELARVHRSFDAKQLELQQQLADPEEEAEAARADRGFLTATATVASYRSAGDRARSLVVPVLGVVLFGVALVCLVLAVVREIPKSIPYFLATTTCGLLLFGLV